jgi:carbon-monoxide dehydrogenase medium subunit
MYLPPFELRRPESVAEAVALLRNQDRDHAVYMGGTELLLLMKLGLAAPEVLVDCKRIPDLRTLSVSGRTLSIGAGATHAELERSPEVNDLLPGLASLSSHLANVRVRTAGTLGGNLCFADPSSDPATLLTAVGANLHLAGPTGRRTVAIADFTDGPYSADLRPGELLVSIDVTVPDPEERVAYERLVLRERPVVSVAIVRGEDWQVSVGGAGQVAMLMPHVGAVLGEGSDAQIAEAASVLSAQLHPADDLDGSADYKRHLATVLLRRAVQQVR